MATQRTDVHHLADAAVVVGVDGSVAADTALDWAADIAVCRDRALRIVHGYDTVGLRRVRDRHGDRVAPMLDAAHSHAAALVERAAQRVRAAAPGVRVSSEATESGAAALLIRESETAYLVVLGAEGTSEFRSHLGSVLLTVAAHGHGAVVVVRTDPASGNAVHRQGPVVVGIDGSPVSEAALAAAFEEASERGAELVAVHAWSDLDLGWFEGESELLVPVRDAGETQRAVLAERLAGWQEMFPDVRVSRRMYVSDPVRALQQWSGSARLLVVGSRGRGGYLGTLLGSTSNSLVQHAECPVMVVHPPRS
ncbi:universal stress protein [Nocardia mexicana]|uniref:Nucleotide-binding universal stress UspA family protein n=1 Tax=Nocardia mexicana TaxID=279262 RepID=A0A370HE47_9NOCA|nr:universal stress protein [Nocardia mexicana]RDI55282.1 nucleotide-binding universal stress UspA family protein [Nocardia mexicana]